MRIALVLALTLRLVADLATPLAPGAFRFDADESVDALRLRTTPDAPGSCVRAVRPDQPPAVTPSRLAATVRRPGRLPAAATPPRAVALRRDRPTPAPSEDG